MQKQPTADNENHNFGFRRNKVIPSPPYLDKISKNDLTSLKTNGLGAFQPIRTFPE